MRDSEHVAALFESLLELAGSYIQLAYFSPIVQQAQYKMYRKRIIDLMVEIELGNTPDWDQINGILPTLEG